MASKRDRRKKKQAEKLRDKKKRNRRKNLEVLKQLGVWNVIKGTCVADVFLDYHFPIPQIQLTDTARHSPHGHDIKQASFEVLKDCRFSAPNSGEEFSFIDYCTTVKPILDLLSVANLVDRPELDQQLRSLYERHEDIAQIDAFASAVDAVMDDLDHLYIQCGRIDSQLYFTTFRFGRTKHKPLSKLLIEFQIDCHIAEPKFIERDGTRRRTYRCGQPFRPKGIEWVEWDGSLIGKIPEKKYQVFVQDHVFRRLDHRVGGLEYDDWLLHEYLWQSLRDPSVIPQNARGDEFLVEYRLNGLKIGYLTVSLLGEDLLVTGFLFLTMDGTPEGNMLWNKLKLKKDDKAYLGLDRIETFVDGDIQHDSEICDLLDECGCGGLFNLLQNPPPLERCKRGDADALRKYLKL